LQQACFLPGYTLIQTKDYAGAPEKYDFRDKNAKKWGKMTDIRK